MLTTPKALNPLYAVPQLNAPRLKCTYFLHWTKSKKFSSDIKHIQSPPRRKKSFMLEPGMAKGGRTSTPFSGTYVLWLGDVVVGVVTAQRGLAGHRQLARWWWVVSKGHQVVVLLKASSCWGVAGFGGLLQVALLLDLSAHGGVPVVLDSIISSATERQTFEKFWKWAFPIQRQVNGQGTAVGIAVKTLFSDLPPTPHHYKCYSQLLRKDARYKG